MKQLRSQVIRAGLEALYLTGAHRLLRPMFAGVGSIYMLHHVRPSRDAAFQPNSHLEITPDFLRAILGHLRSHGIDIITMDECSRRLSERDFAGPFACFSFDDGYRDNRDFALPVMREVHAQTGETVNLSVRHDEEIVYVERTSSGRAAMRIVHMIGTRAPLHITAAGKLFLLEDGFARLREYAKRTGLAPHTKNTLSTPSLLERDLERTQRQGYATDNEEAEIGVRCVAAAVRDDAGHLIGALSLSTPADRMKPQWGPLVKEAAERISRAIGHRP